MSQMSRTDQKRVQELRRIAEERPCPLSEWEQEFVTTLDHQLPRGMSEKQAAVFERLVQEHLIGDDDLD